ncbi:hypothetical protein E2320_022293 [Naja naja]|nr:hypothetical protein E2320_022293 [Naja naja]
MVAPRLLGNRRLWDSSTSFFLLQLLLSTVGAKQEPITADFDVRPGGRRYLRFYLRCSGRDKRVSHREGKFHSELSKLMIVAEKSHDEL